MFSTLDQLSNFHFVPSQRKKESAIQTANVPSLMLEEAVPISVSLGATKSAREVLSVYRHQLQDKTELTKEERRKERAGKKRKIKAH